MRYFYKIPEDTRQVAGVTYECPNSKIYSRGTLFKEGDIGLVLIQQRYNLAKKTCWWSEIDPWLASDIYLSPLFKDVFAQYAAEPIDGVYPALTVRQIMYLCKLKPLTHNAWETSFTTKPLY